MNKHKKNYNFNLADCGMIDSYYDKLYYEKTGKLFEELLADDEETPVNKEASLNLKSIIDDAENHYYQSINDLYDLGCDLKRSGKTYAADACFSQIVKRCDELLSDEINPESFNMPEQVKKIYTKMRDLSLKAMTKIDGK